jgi:hypothetical protein
MSGPIGIAKQRPGLLPLHMLQAAFTEDELAQLVEDQPRLGVAASLTWIVRRLYLYSLGFAHRSSLSVVAYCFDSILWPDSGLVQTDDSTRSLWGSGGMHWTQ